MRAAALTLWALVLAPVASAYSPQVNYQLQCMGCHRGDGSGESGRVPNVRTTLVPFSALAAGRDFVLRVPGVAQAKLSDAELAALLNWMAEKLSDVPMTADFVLYTAAEVAAVRQQPMASVQTRRAALVAQISH
jgi:hypothetical protein